MSIKLALFDYDGTLRDSKSLIYESLQYAFAANDLPTPSKNDLAPHIHHHTFVYQELAPEITLDEFEAAYGEKLDVLLPHVQLYDGVTDTLETLQSAGYEFGLVTAAKRVKDEMRRFGIDGYFSVIVSANDITRHKPDPQGINLALERTGYDKDEAVYIGDMVTDIYAARAAGLRATIGITHGMANRRELETADADVIVDSLSELPKIFDTIDGNGPQNR